MTKKPRFGSFVTAAQPAQNDQPEPAAEPVPIISPLEPIRTIPKAPVREERRPFSTRLRPSQKAALDAFVMELKLAGWPVSQEAVLEELVHLLQEDGEVRTKITARLTNR